MILLDEKKKSDYTNCSLNKIRCSPRSYQSCQHHVSKREEVQTLQPFPN